MCSCFIFRQLKILQGNKNITFYTSVKTKIGIQILVFTFIHHCFLTFIDTIRELIFIPDTPVFSRIQHFSSQKNKTNWFFDRTKIKYILTIKKNDLHLFCKIDQQSLNFIKFVQWCIFSRIVYVMIITHCSHGINKKGWNIHSGKKVMVRICSRPAFFN